MDQRVEAKPRLAINKELLANLFEQAPGFMAVLRGPDHIFELANPAYRKLIGNRDIIGKPVAEVAPEAAEQGFLDILNEVFRTGEAYSGKAMEVHLADREESMFVDFVNQPIIDEAGKVTGIFIQGTDVTARTRAERYQATQSRLLESAFQNEGLEELLSMLIHAVEEESQSEVIGSILLLDEDGKHLLHGAAPSLPQAYNDAIHGIEIGPEAGSCGTAAFKRQPVFVSDVRTDPKWADFKDLALENGLLACWSIPIMSAAGDLLGTFAMYHRQPREPLAADIELVDFVIRTAAVIIERKQAETALEEERQTLEKLNQTGEVIAGELDLDQVVQEVTDAGVKLTGAEFGAFFYNVNEPNGESYMLYTLSGVDRKAFEQFPMPRKTDIFAPTFDGDGIVRSDDITTDPRYGRNAPHKGMPEGHLPVTSYLAVPVKSRSGEVIGGLFFGHPAKGQFKERHERLMVGIAAQAAVAIDNARLYRAAQTEIQDRKQTEAALIDISRRFDAVLNNTRMAVFLMDERQFCVYANAAAEDLTGYSFDELQGKALHDVIHHTRPDGSHYPLEECPIDRAFPENAQTEGEEIFVHRDGSFYPVHFTASPIRDEASNTIGTIIEVRNIADEKERAAELAEALRTKDILLHEVNHRVKNSLQVVTSLLTLQARKADDANLEKSLQEARNRVAVIAAMHQRLYATSDHDHVDFGDYLADLAEEAMQSMSSSEHIELRTAIDRGIVMNLRQAVPLALVVSELITNAIKYAYPPEKGGEVFIGLDNKGDHVALCIKDDGVGLPDGFDPAKSDGLGMKIVTSLLRQVRGELSLPQRPEGAQFDIKIPVEKTDK
ncbi:GAF domain-containing protein [Sphingomicrobium marinum]|uniref:GAF domain-containing protein n=1 Tax=Sphingomicrobium marinum TaxID=1227950 RepID=UPI00223FFA17|nr:GAF domain-containing protein [Sphingomicrobium marinum]